MAIKIVLRTWSGRLEDVGSTFQVDDSPRGIEKYLRRVDILQSHWLNGQSPNGVGSTWVLLLLDVRHHPYEGIPKH